MADFYEKVPNMAHTVRGMVESDGGKGVIERGRMSEGESKQK